MARYRIIVLALFSLFFGSEARSQYPPGLPDAVLRAALNSYLAAPQDQGDPSIAVLRALADAHPHAVVRFGPDDGTLEALMGVRISGFVGAPRDVGAMFLEEIFADGSPAKQIGGFDVVRTFDSQAGGRRILYRGAKAHEGRDYLVGVNRIRDGERFYVDESGRVAPPGFVFVRSTESVDFEEVRSDWYVYFAMRSEARETGHVASRSSESARHPSLAGAGGPLEEGTATSAPSALLRDLCSTGDYTANGQGFAYAANPLYGEPGLATLPNLCDQTPMSLNGRHARVYLDSDEGPTVVEGPFLFEPEEPEFDAVSVYFHIDRFLTLMKNRGFPVPDALQIDVRTRSADTRTAIAHYRTAEMTFGVPSPPFRNAAHEAALIAHESTHILMYPLSASYFGWGEKEHWAMGESYADYFGLYYRSEQLQNGGPWYEPIFAGYVAEETSQDLPRNLLSPLPHYSGYGTTNYVGSEDGPAPINLYDNSVIFSTALVDYDRTDDSDNSASFVIESLVNMPVTPSFRTGRDALMIAASQCAISEEPDTYECCEEGSCHQGVAFAFESRGIGEADEGVITGVNAYDGSAPPFTHVLAIEGAYPNPFAVQTTIAFSVSRPEEVRIDVYDASGRRVSRLMERTVSSGRHDIRWAPRDLPSGPYFFEVRAGSSIRRASVVYVR